jgi:GNAT superfamily N-acetyltransferase
VGVQRLAHAWCGLLADSRKQLVIREAILEDVTEILSLSKADEHFQMSEFTGMHDEEELRYWISDPRSIVIVATSRSRVIGYACGFILSPKWFFFDTFLVAPEFRNRGIGTRLYEHLRKMCKRQGSLQLIQGVVKAGKGNSLRYWTGLGFEKGNRCIWVEDWLDDE